MALLPIDDFSSNIKSLAVFIHELSSDDYYSNETQIKIFARGSSNTQRYASTLLSLGISSSVLHADLDLEDKLIAVYLFNHCWARIIVADFFEDRGKFLLSPRDL
jgi:superfamily II DNA/RNA helicase